MTKEFVTYKQALALKKLGFDEPCFMIYYDGTDELRGESHFLYSRDIKAPTYSAAFRWFREKHNLHSTIAFTSDSIFAKGGYMFMVDIIEPHKALDNDNTYKTYEEAESACLDKLIEICRLSK